MSKQKCSYCKKTIRHLGWVRKGRSKKEPLMVCKRKECLERFKQEEE